MSAGSYPLAAQATGQIMVAFEDPSDLQMIGNLNKQLKIDIVPYMAARRSLESLLQQRSVSLQLDVGMMAESNRSLGSGPKVTLTSPTVDSDSQIAKMIEQILKNAYHYKASDIHIEPSEGRLRVRMRIDGTLRELTSNSDPGQALPKANHRPNQSLV